MDSLCIDGVPIAIAYVMCSRIVSETGGDCIYVARGLGPIVGAVAGVLMWVAYIYIIAAIARGVSRYVVSTNNILAEIIVAAAVIWSLTLINIVGVKVGGKINTILTISKIVPLVIFSAFVAIKAVLGSLPNVAQNDLGIDERKDLFYAVAATLWAYLGFESASTPTKEVKKSSYVYTAILVSMVVVTVLYLAVSGAALAALPWTILANAKAPLYEAAKAVGGEALATIIYCGAFVSMMGCLAACILSNARRGYALAIDGVLPKFLSTLSIRGVPARMLLLQGFVATIFAVAMNFVSLYLVADFASLVPYLLVALALPRLYKGSSKFVGALIVGIIAACSSLFLMMMVASSEPQTVAVGAALAMIVAFVSAIRRIKARR